MEEKGQRNRLTLWLTFLVASTMLLTIEVSLAHYSASSGGTLLDLIGSILPYLMITLIVSFYIVRSGFRKFKPSVKLRGGSLSGILRGLALGVLNFLVSLIPVIFLIALLSKGLVPIGGQSPTVTEPPQSSIPQTAQTNAISLNLLSFLASFTVLFIFGALAIAAFLLKRGQYNEEPVTEGKIGAIPSQFRLNRFIDDQFRKAILSYYARGRRHMSIRGATLVESMTPREFARNVEDSIRGAGKNFNSLTCLFEEARFSTHAMGAPERSKARTAYEKLRRIVGSSRDGGR